VQLVVSVPLSKEAGEMLPEADVTTAWPLWVEYTYETSHPPPMVNLFVPDTGHGTVVQTHVLLADTLLLNMPKFISSMCVGSWESEFSCAYANINAFIAKRRRRRNWHMILGAIV